MDNILIILMIIFNIIAIFVFWIVDYSGKRRLKELRLILKNLELQRYDLFEKWGTRNDVDIKS